MSPGLDGGNGSGPGMWAEDYRLLRWSRGADDSPQPFDTFGIGLVCKELVEGAIECLFTVTSPSGNHKFS